MMICSEQNRFHTPELINSNSQPETRHDDLRLSTPEALKANPDCRLMKTNHSKQNCLLMSHGCDCELGAIHWRKKRVRHSSLQVSWA
ncbi:hypothetical protein Ddye_005745 [Dipteronia dyeriana]|uniref:Uncharacterized protein n=1 Tax=Dipteronia dyeriana TaxID=168575 RepID=A0AAD9XH38_9ROSI|nr:hypothetical protein Ddye_005745 [Dipteronia dyeriana]